MFALYCTGYSSYCLVHREHGKRKEKTEVSAFSTCKYTHSPLEKKLLATKTKPAARQGIDQPRQELNSAELIYFAGGSWEESSQWLWWISDTNKKGRPCYPSSMPRGFNQCVQNRNRPEPVHHEPQCLYSYVSAGVLWR